MKRTKEETIAIYLNDFLSGRTKEFIDKFNQKTTLQKYGAIINWRRNKRLREESINSISKNNTDEFFKLLKSARKEADNILSLSQKESKKAILLIEEIKSIIVNFDKIKKQRIINDLLNQEQKILKEKDNIRRKIETLQEEIS